MPKRRRHRQSTAQRAAAREAAQREAAAEWARHCERERHREREARRRVIAQYARRFPSGSLVFCTPSQAEWRGTVPRKQGPGTDGKPIYDSREAAEACARGLEAVGAKPMRAFLCGRSRSGHYHLTSDRSAAAAPAPEKGTPVNGQPTAQDNVADRMRQLAADNPGIAIYPERAAQPAPAQASPRPYLRAAIDRTAQELAANLRQMPPPPVRRHWVSADATPPPADTYRPRPPFSPLLMPALSELPDHWQHRLTNRLNFALLLGSPNAAVTTPAGDGLSIRRSRLPGVWHWAIYVPAVRHVPGRRVAGGWKSGGRRALRTLIAAYIQHTAQRGVPNPTQEQ